MRILGLCIRIVSGPSRSRRRSTLLHCPLNSKNPVALMRPNLNEAREVRDHGLSLEVQLVDAPDGLPQFICSRGIVQLEKESLHSALPCLPSPGVLSLVQQGRSKPARVNVRHLPHLPVLVHLAQMYDSLGEILRSQCPDILYHTNSPYGFLLRIFSCW